MLRRALNGLRREKSLTTDIKTIIDQQLTRPIVGMNHEISGSLSHDTFVFTGNELNASIANFNASADTLDFNAASSEESLTILTAGGDSIISGAKFLFLDASDSADAAA